MAIITTYVTAKKDTQINHEGAFFITKRITLPAAGVSNGDNVQAIVMPAGVRCISVDVTVLATLGAGATVKAQLNRGGTRTDLTSATTAGAASKANSVALVNIPLDLAVDDVIELLIGGANVSASALVTLDLDCQRL